MCKQHALRIAWTIARSIAFLDFRVLRWKFTYDWKCVNTTYRVPLFCPLPASRKGLRLTLRSALFGEGGRDWRPWILKNEPAHGIFVCLFVWCLTTHQPLWNFCTYRINYAQKPRLEIVSMIRKYHKLQTADKPVASWGRATQQSRDTRKKNKAKLNQLSDDCTTRMYTK